MSLGRNTTSILQRRELRCREVWELAQGFTSHDALFHDSPSVSSHWGVTYQSETFSYSFYVTKEGDTKV